MTDIKKIKSLTIIDIINDVANMTIKLGIRLDKAGLLKSSEKNAILNNTSNALAAVASILDIEQSDIEDWMEKEVNKLADEQGMRFKDMVNQVTEQMKREAN